MKACGSSVCRHEQKGQEKPSRKVKHAFFSLQKIFQKVSLYKILKLHDILVKSMAYKGFHDKGQINNMPDMKLKREGPQRPALYKELHETNIFENMQKQ